MVVGTMGLAVLRELGPVICGLILAGRSGSAMTSGIGAMHLTGEYDALRAFGSSPSLRLALPRVIGAAISVPLVVVWADFTALIGGAVTAQADLGVGWRLFLAQLPEQVQIVSVDEPNSARGVVQRLTPKGYQLEAVIAIGDSLLRGLVPVEAATVGREVGVRIGEVLLYADGELVSDAPVEDAAQ